MKNKKDEKVVIPTDVDELTRYEKELGGLNYFDSKDDLESGIILSKIYLICFRDKQYYGLNVGNDDGYDIIAPIDEIVAVNFVPNPNNYDFIRHINGDTLDNRPDNLEWVKELN